MARRLLALLVTCMMVHLVMSELPNNIETESDADDAHILSLPFAIKTKDDLIKNIFEAYRKCLETRKVAELDSAQEHGQYQLWKRNADIINTLLGFPRRMLVAGR